MSRDVTILRDLAKRYADAAAKPVQDERRRLWRDHNSLVRTRPLVICTGLFFWHELGIYENARCSDKLFRNWETSLQIRLLCDRLNDDMVMEPYLVVPPVYATPSGQDRWGARIVFSELTEKGGSFKMLPPIKEESDFGKLVAYPHKIDEPATSRQYERLQDAIGDIVPLAQSRQPLYSGWSADISTDIARLRGLEQIMWDMLDRPQWLHKVCAFLRDGVLAQHDQAESAGDWRKINSYNQAVNYSRDLPDPVADGQATDRKDLWCFLAAQEMAQVSPAMHEEFILQYQLPIMAKFGLVAYGCCEDLTNKIGMLKRIPNLRRISVTPWANVRKCAEQIGTDYVMSWRPSPAEMICNGFEPQRIRRVIRQGLSDARPCHVDITLKDVQTVAGNFDNLVEWVRIVREVIDETA